MLNLLKKLSFVDAESFEVPIQTESHFQRLQALFVFGLLDEVGYYATIDDGFNVGLYALRVKKPPQIHHQLAILVTKIVEKHFELVDHFDEPFRIFRDF